MPSSTTWYTDYTQEISHAHSARIAGNEGMARVCARRAVGILVGEYLQYSGQTDFGPSVIQRLNLLASMPDLDPQTKQVIGHFLLSVDKDHRLPADINLISEAQWLAHTLLKQE